MANKSKVVKFRPAGKNDNFIVVGTDINTIIEKEKFELKASEKGVKIEALSTELTENLSIKAYDNETVQTKADIINLDSRKAQKEAKNKTTNIDEYRKSKQKDSGREIG